MSRALAVIVGLSLLMTAAASALFAYADSRANGFGLELGGLIVLCGFALLLTRSGWLRPYESALGIDRRTVKNAGPAWSIGLGIWFATISWLMHATLGSSPGFLPLFAWFSGSIIVLIGAHVVRARFLRAPH